MKKQWLVSSLFALLGLFSAAHAADPVIVLSAAKQGGAYFAIGQRLQRLLSDHRIDSGILASAGSLENLKRLADPDHSANIAFTQADAVYTFEDIAVVRGEGHSDGLSVETICTEALIVAATAKINPGMLTVLETVLDQQWMLIYPD